MGLSSHERLCLGKEVREQDVVMLPHRVMAYRRGYESQGISFVPWWISW